MVVERMEEKVLEIVKWCQEKKEPPSVWSTELANCVRNYRLPIPSIELGEVLVSHLCFSNNHPSLWKLIDYALSSGLLIPIHIISLLTSRVIPQRHSQPEAYRLYLELLSQHIFSTHIPGAYYCQHRIIESIDAALQLSKTYKIQISGVGLATCLTFFSITVHLVNSTLEDVKLSFKSVQTADEAQKIGIDSGRREGMMKFEHREKIKGLNLHIALEVLAKLGERREALILLRLVHLNMPEKFNELLQTSHILKAQQSKSIASPESKYAHHNVVRLCTHIQRSMESEFHLNRRQLSGMLIDGGYYKSPFCRYVEVGSSSCWVSFDIYMENVMDGRQLPVTSAIDILKETISTLQVLNRASWQETFLALWISSLRLVQRERDPLEGPVPHLDARLCMLLSIVPLAIARVLEDEAEFTSVHTHTLSSSTKTYGHELDGDTSRKQGLTSSLQVLGQFNGLLCPPASVVGVANNAAIKALNFISKYQNLKDGFDQENICNSSVKADGDMRHLIMEACIARKLMDQSAYFWPGYMSPLGTCVSNASLEQSSPWTTFMEGASLIDPLIDALVSNPAASVVEIEKLYCIALQGSEDEKVAAAKILCGASLCRGWNIQEHVVRFVVQLLSPPPPPNFTGSGSYLVDHMPMLKAVLHGASSIDNVHILSLHGVVPEVAAALMPLCEVFGSLLPASSCKSNIGDESSVYAVFSSAFLFLLRLWKFYRPPLDHYVSCKGAIGSELTLEYLLLLRNSRIMPRNSPFQGEISNGSSISEAASDKPIYIDTYPKLCAWYCLNKSCIASTLSGLCSRNPIHQIANKILHMICANMKMRPALSVDSSTSSSSSINTAVGSSGEAPCQIPLLPAWEVLEAVPLVIEAMLTACAHEKLSSKELTTGLRDLVDFLPASIASIISYISAEVTRGIWKLVPMNGTDWPSPAAALFSVESEIKDILTAAGVNLPSSPSGGLPAMLPLPMAALVSLTITFKLDKSLGYIHAVAGPAMENCAASCPWPSMPIIGSLWAQKIPRWHNFIVVSCSRSVFRQSRSAVAQLLESCFTSFLGMTSSVPSFSNCSSVSALLGSTITTNDPLPVVSPGFLYLRSCRAIQNVQYVNDVIAGLVAEYAGKYADGLSGSGLSCLKSNRASLALAATKAKEVAALGASLLCVAGGLQRVQELYQETIPTWLLSRRAENGKQVQQSVMSCTVEGYAMAFLLVLSGSLVWSAGAKPTSWASSRRACIVEVHLNFIAGALEGKILLGCNPATWKAYVSCLVGLIVSFSPAWIQEVKVGILMKLANGLGEWHELELAISLLERGGLEAIESVTNILNRIN